MAFGIALAATGLIADPVFESNGLLATNLTVAGGLITFPMNTANRKNLTWLDTSSANYYWTTGGPSLVLSAWITVTGTPTSDIALLTDGAQDATQRYLRIGTDRKLKIYDLNGNLIASSSTALTANTEYEIVVTFDCLTLSTVWVSLWLGTAGGTMTEEIAVNTGLTTANFATSGSSGSRTLGNTFGEWYSTGAKGADVKARYVTARWSLTAGDMPQTTAYPRLVAYGAFVPAANGAAQTWTNGTTNPGIFQDVDELPNDGATTEWAQIGQTSGTYNQLAAHQTANSLSSSAVIVAAQVRAVGKLDAAGKFGALGSLYLSPTVYIASARYGNGRDLSTYSCQGDIRGTNPATSAAWVYTDWDLTGGNSKWQFGCYVTGSGASATGGHVTAIRSLEAIYSTANLALAVAPAAGFKHSSVMIF
jgi:hypothetical protein